MASLTISVAMCTFNGGRFLSQQLDSIAAQDRPPDELVVCDDGSSDGSIDIVRNFAARAAFVTRLIVNTQNLGSTRNFEHAISLCQGTIVALADQDDIWYSHKLKRIEDAFQQSEQIVAVFSDGDLIDDDSKPLGSHLWPTFGFDKAKQKQFANGQGLKVLIRHPVVTGAAMAFRRDLFDAMRPIPTNEIHDRWISFLLAARGRFAIIPEPLMQYRRHQRQQVGPGPLTLEGQVAQAKARGADHYVEEIDRFHRFYEKLEEQQSTFPDAHIAKNEIEKKLVHLEHRARLPRRKVARIPGVLKEVFNGHYWRYSGGWRSLAKDLIIR